jgi:hypothetical protein
VWNNNANNDLVEQSKKSSLYVQHKEYNEEAKKDKVTSAITGKTRYQVI